MNWGLGHFPYKERKLLKEECGPATAELASTPASGPQRLFLHTRGGNFCYNYVAALPSAGAPRNWRFSTSCTRFRRANPYCWHLTVTRELQDHF